MVVGQGEDQDHDRALVDALRARDETAFVDLVDRWGATMLRVARLHVSTSASAEEVVQDTWVAVLHGLDGFEARSSIRTWVFRILVNIAKTRGTREHRVVPMSTSATVDPTRFRPAGDEWPGHWSTLPEAWPTPEQDALGSEVRRVVSEAVAGLPERQRLVLSLRDVHGMSADEVCAILDLTDGHQRVLLHRGRAAVRARLEAFYGSGARWGATP